MLFSLIFSIVQTTAPCFIDETQPNTGYFVKPAGNALAMLIVGWVLVLIGIIQCVLFGMFMCCGFKFSSLRCCHCSKSSSYTTTNPLYSNTYYGNTTSATTTNISTPMPDNVAESGKSLSRSGSSVDVEMTPIPPIGAAGGAAAYVPPATVVEESSASSSRSSSDGGAGTGAPAHNDNWGGYAE